MLETENLKSEISDFKGEPGPVERDRPGLREGSVLHETVENGFPSHYEFGYTRLKPGVNGAWFCTSLAYLVKVRFRP
jgi:hypothetical protein